MTDINKEYEKEYYDEYRNNYYNPDDDDAEPGINLNWKRIQKGFHSVAANDQETAETLSGMQATLGTLNTDVETLKTDVETLNTDVETLETDVETLTEDVDEIKYYVTPQMFGAMGDGIADDTAAFNSAIASGKPVLVPTGTYNLSEMLKMPNESTITGADRSKTVLQFADGVSGIEINRRTFLSNLSISISGDAAGIYLFVPELYANNLSSICQNITINHRSNTINGNGILLVAQQAQNINGAFNLTFRNIDIIGDIEFGIHLLSKVKTTAKYEAYMTDVVFSDIFVAASKIAIISDWEDISGTNAVPQTGEASIFGAIKFINVSAQCKTNVSTAFCKIMNIYDGLFTNCTPFDYYLIVSSTNAAYIINATNGMCLLDMGFLPEISYDLTRWFKFENQTNFNQNFKTAIRFINTPSENKSYGLFYNHVSTLYDDNVITLTDTTNSSIIAANMSTCGNIVMINLEIRLETISAGNNSIGVLSIPPHMPFHVSALFGRSSETGTPLRLSIDGNGNLTAISTSGSSTWNTIRASLIYIRKYYLYG